MLYTRKGDKGDTSAFGCKQRFSKNSALTEALGSVDELNSLLGICKIKAQTKELREIIESTQQNLFIVQASLAGADKKINQEKIDGMEKIIDEIEKKLPPIKNFFLAGGSEIAVYLDYARTVARRAERRVVALAQEKKIEKKIDEEILIYLNRLSSLLYALAREVNFQLGINEKKPDYS